MPEDTLNPAVDTSNPDGVVETEVTEVQKQEIIEQAENQQIDVDSGDEEVEVQDDSGKRSWYDQLPPDMQNDPNVTKYKSLAEFTKAHREVLKTLGKDKVVVPTDKSTPEEVEAFYGKLGKPKTPDEYKTPAFDENIAEEVRISEDAIEDFKKFAFDRNFTQQQYEDGIEYIQQRNNAMYDTEIAKYNNMAQNTETELRKEWGAAYETKVENAQKVVNTFFGGKNIDKAFQVLAKDKGFVMAMSEISENLGEDAIKGTPRFTKTPQEAQSEVNEILGRRHPLSEAYFDELNPEHNAAMDMVISLQTMANANQ